MIKVKNMAISRDQEEIILSTINKAYTEFSLLTNTNVYENLDEKGLEIFKEYDIHIEIPNAPNITLLKNIKRIKVSDDDSKIEFFTNSNDLVFILSLEKYFYSLFFNDDEKFYTIKATDRFVNLELEYPIINSVIEEVKNGLYEGRLYLKVSPLDFNSRCLVFWYRDADYDMVSLKLLEFKKIIEQPDNIRLFTQLFTLSSNSIIVYMNDDIYHIGKCIYKDEYKMICKNIDESVDEEEFSINYTDILNNVHFYVLLENVNLVKLYDNTLQLMSNLQNSEDLELDLLNGIDLIKSYKSNTEKITSLYSILSFGTSEIEEEELEKYKLQLDTLTRFMDKFNSLRILLYGGYLLIDKNNEISAVNNVSKIFRYLDLIREYLYPVKE